MWALCSLKTKDAPTGCLLGQEEIETLHRQGLQGLMPVLPSGAVGAGGPGRKRHGRSRQCI